MNDEVVTKADVRGRRNVKSKTTKKHPTHYFDDEKDIKGGRRGHGRMTNNEFSLDLDEDDPYANDIEFMLRYV